MSKLIFSYAYWNILLVVLRLYIGKYQDAYRGAKFFKSEAQSLIKRIKLAICPPFDETKGIDIESPEEAMAIIRALEIYIGKYPEAYGGAKYFRDETEKIYTHFVDIFRDEINFFTDNKGETHERNKSFWKNFTRNIAFIGRTDKILLGKRNSKRNSYTI